MITSVEEMIEQYVSAWNETNLEAYQREFGKCWATDATYTDPSNEKISGLKGIASFAHDSLPAAPTRKFSVAIKPDYHHHVGRYIWSVTISGESKEGYDYFEFNDDFKITRLVSFFKSL